MLDVPNFEFEIRFELDSPPVHHFVWALTFDVRFFFCLNPKNAQQKIYHSSYSKGNGDDHH
jgi:hypothetical protein